jgi:outer membrane protein assembly factor BamB
MFENNVRQIGMGRLHAPASASAASDPLSELRELLLGASHELRELPALPDLAAAAIALASGARRKVILPLSHAAAEIALVRRGEHVFLDCYGTESAPEILVRGHEIVLQTLLDACMEASSRVAQQSAEVTSAAAMTQLAQRLAKTSLRVDPHPRLRPVAFSGGSLASPGSDVPLAFGFDAEVVPTLDQALESHAFADVHALLFQGTLFAFSGSKRRLLFEGPIMLAAQRMVDAVRALVEAWQADRNLHVRLCSGSFWVAVRRQRGGEVALSLSGGRGDALSWPALEINAAALPILRLVSDLIRKLIATDRRQSHNLRVTQLRSEVRALRRIIRTRSRRQSFENADPERLRPQVPDARPARPVAQESLSMHPAGLRYSERWSVEIDGLDAAAVHLCGDRVLVASQKLTLALDRSNGEVLWSFPSAGATSMMAGRKLLRLLPEGALELHEVEDGSVYARSRLSARGGGAAPGLFAGGNGLPPMAILTEARQQLCAIDLRTGQPRWRFRAHGPSSLQISRNGRVLCVTSGDGTVDALDVATGEVVWRFSDGARFCLKPRVCREVVVAVAGEPRGGAGAAYGIELYSGRLLWQRELPAAPSTDPIDAGEVVVVPVGRSRQARLLALDSRTGAQRWSRPDPGLDNGGQALCLDRAIIVNTPSGRVLGLDLDKGQTRWERQLSNPLTDDVPRQLEPLVRQGALFVPSAQVHVLRPQDGSPLGQIGCDLVPDCLRVDERGWFYVAEESGHLAAHAAAPQLCLVK